MDVLPEARGRRFGIIVSTRADEPFNQPPRINVERAMYSGADGTAWSAGTCVGGTRLSPLLP